MCSQYDDPTTYDQDFDPSCQCCIDNISEDEHRHNTYCFEIGSIDFLLMAHREANAFAIKEGQLTMSNRNHAQVMMGIWWSQNFSYMVVNYVAEGRR